MASGWERKPLLPVPESKPPLGRYKIVNMFIEPETGKIVVEYDNDPVN